jgi:hypothetical protein
MSLESEFLTARLWLWKEAVRGQQEGKAWLQSVLAWEMEGLAPYSGWDLGTGAGTKPKSMPSTSVYCHCIVSQRSSWSQRCIGVKYVNLCSWCCNQGCRSNCSEQLWGHRTLRGALHLSIWQQGNRSSAHQLLGKAFSCQLGGSCV